MRLVAERMVIWQLGHLFGGDLDQARGSSKPTATDQRPARPSIYSLPASSSSSQNPIDVYDAIVAVNVEAATEALQRDITEGYNF